MAKFETKLHGKMDEVIERVDHQLRQGKHALTLFEKTKIQSQNMDVIVRIYEKISFFLRETTSVTIMFIDKKDGNIDICGISSDKQYGILRKEYSRGKKIIEACRTKIDQISEEIWIQLPIKMK